MNIASMSAHFSANVQGSLSPPDCLPFPAGPSLPRQETLSPPLIQHRLSNLERIQLAYSLWPAEKGGQHKDKADYTGSTDRLHLLATRAWCHLHQTDLNKPTDVLDAWSRWQDSAGAESVNERDLRMDREELIRGRLLSKESRGLSKKQGNGMPDEAYSAPEYTCACRAQAPVIFKGIETDKASIQLARLACDDDKWAMLMRFWFKQLLGHHSYTWTSSTEGSDVHAYFGTALDIVHRVRHQPQHPLAPVARALTLTRLLPPPDAVNAKKWVDGLRSPLWRGRGPLPLPLCPGSLGSPRRNVKTLLDLADDLCITKEEILQVDTLAREVASLMTDPWVSSRLHWKKAEVETLQRRLSEETKDRRRPAFLARVDDTSDLQNLLDRRQALQKNLQWSSDTWHARNNRLSDHTHLKGKP